MSTFPISFVSANTEWGGSEELWAQTATVLAARGHRITAFAALAAKDRHRLDSLQQSGVRTVACSALQLPWPLRAANRLLPDTQAFTPQDRAASMLLKSKPGLVVISQWGNLDGLRWARVCHQHRLPYVLIAHQASPADWPKDSALPEMLGAYQRAIKCYFVSRANRELTECQLGARLERTEIIRNPYRVSSASTLPWPPAAPHFKWACVARLSAKDKGQDLLLQVLARPRWRERPVSVSFYGTGLNHHGLQQLARLLALSQVEFCGYTPDVASIWQHHHCLVLPSRHEGLPIAIVEAMMCGRPCIVTDVAGNAEVVSDESTGFVAAAPTLDALDDAMERAWQRRHDWCSMGQSAAARIRESVPGNPAALFADKLLALLATRPA